MRLQDEALAAFRSPEIQGEVRIGVCDDCTMRSMPPILAGYAERHPGAHIRLDSQSSDRLIRATLAGELDFPLVNIASGDIEQECLVSEPLVRVASGRHLVHERSSVPVAIGATPSSSSTMLAGGSVPRRPRARPPGPRRIAPPGLHRGCIGSHESARADVAPSAPFRLNRWHGVRGARDTRAERA